jgi:hypothetical protein
MIRVFQIVFLFCLPFCLTGCGGPEETEPIWEQLKIGDLTPSQSGKGPGGQLLKTANFNIYIFEIPAGNIGALDNVWRMLYLQPLQFNNYNTFRANSFVVGFGQAQMWRKIIDSLLAADGKGKERVSLLLPDGKSNDLPIARLDNKQTVFYISSEGSMEGESIGPGMIALRIKAEKIPGSRGVCHMSILPIFSPPIIGSIPELVYRAKTGEFLFSSVGFGLKMSPGDLVVLGPEEYIDHKITLGSLFFSRPEGSLFFSRTERKPPERKEAVTIFLLVCTGINY